MSTLIITTRFCDYDEQLLILVKIMTYDHVQQLLSFFDSSQETLGNASSTVDYHLSTQR